MGKISILAVGLAFLLAGCTQDSYIPSINTVSNANSTAQITRIADSRVITDDTFAQMLVMTEIRESQTNDGYNQIQVFFKNCSGRSLSFKYRFEWYNQNGVLVDNPDQDLFVLATVATGDDIVLTAIAPRKDCKDFKMRIINASY